MAPRLKINFLSTLAIHKESNKKPMKNTISTALALMTILFAGGCATQKSSDPTAPTGPPAATLTLTGAQAGYNVAGATGKGTLSFQGRSRNFTVNSVGAGGTGVQAIEAVGEVHYLTSLADFPGTYTGARSGLTLFKGKMHERLENANGTVIYLTGKTAGLASSTGIDKMLITLD